MDYYKVQVPLNLKDEMEYILSYYDYKYDIDTNCDNKITRIKNNGQTVSYDDIESFLHNEIRYKKKKNLHYYVLDN